MANNIDRLLPSITVGFISRVLLIEVYFLLRIGKSPAYFTLTDFLDAYSIELLYLTVSLSLLTGWVLVPALAAYTLLFGFLAWLTRATFGLIRIQGIPIFKALSQHKRENSVSLEIAKDYAKSHADITMQKRIKEYETESREHLSNEALASANFLLLLVAFWISHSTGAPNFLMKVTTYADPYLMENAYEVCIVLLAIQGVLGRISSFHLLSEAGSLPPSFFKDDEERKAVADWATKVVGRFTPLAEKWLNKRW